METVTNFIFLGSKITADGDSKQQNLKMLAPWKESYDKSKQFIKKQYSETVLGRMSMYSKLWLFY